MKETERLKAATAALQGAKDRVSVISSKVLRIHPLGPTEDPTALEHDDLAELLGASLEYSEAVTQYVTAAREAAGWRT